MIGTATTFALLLCVASLCSAFEFDFLGRGRPLGFAPNNMRDALINKAAVESEESNEVEDNAGFERSQIFGGRSPSNTRRLLHEPPLKKRSVEHRLIREPPLKRSITPIDLVYRFPYTVQKASRFAPANQPIDF